MCVQVLDRLKGLGTENIGSQNHIDRGVYTMQALEQMLHEKSGGGTFLAYFTQSSGGSLFQYHIFNWWTDLQCITLDDKLSTNLWRDGGELNDH